MTCRWRRRLAVTALVLIASVLPLRAQTVLSTTVLQNDLDANSPVSGVLLANAGSASAGSVIWMNGEAMLVTAKVNDLVTVRRAYGTPARTHALGSLVYLGPSSAFTAATVAPGASCASASVLPHISLTSGAVSQCIDGKWAQVTQPGTPTTGTGPVVLGVSPALSGTVTGTYTLGGTPTISNPTIVGAHGAAESFLVPNDLGTPDLADDNFFLTSVAMQATAYTLDETDLAADQPPRNVTVTHTAQGTADTLGDAVIVGTDVNDDPITETIAIDSGTVAAGTKAFKTVTSVVTADWVIDGVEASEDLLEVGFGDLLGLGRPLAAASQVFLVVYDTGVVVDAVIAVDDTLVEENTVDFSGATYDGAKVAKVLLIP